MKEQKVDEYIAKAADFAQPILEHIRDLVHQVCPEVKETIKWGFPNFEYKGVFCSMAAFKQHCVFTFWKASLLEDPYKIFINVGTSAMGQLGKLQSISDLPSDKVLKEYIKEAIILNEKGIKIQKPLKGQSDTLQLPQYLLEAFAVNEKAKINFEAFSNSNKKEYLDWLKEAKTEKTLQKRLATAIEWIAENKSKNWKYKK